MDGAQKLSETVADLKGFYVKTAQIISSRQDLFPKEYTEVGIVLMLKMTLFLLYSFLLSF